MNGKNSRATAAILVAAALLSGCVTQIQPNRPAYVYVAENGVVTFMGDQVKTADLPQRMIRAGAKPETHIMVVPQGNVPREHLSKIVMDCGEKGLPNCTIREPRKITVLTGKDAERARIEAEKNAKPKGVAGNVRTVRKASRATPPPPAFGNLPPPGQPGKLPPPPPGQ